MWSLTPTLCTLIPSKKAKEAVLTLTDYKPNPERDNHIIEVLKQDYSKVIFLASRTSGLFLFQNIEKTNRIENHKSPPK